MQFDQILTALQSDTRDDLKRLLEGYGTALTYEPTAADDAARTPTSRARPRPSRSTARSTTRPARCKNAAIVNNALLGLAAARPVAAGRANTAKVTKALCGQRESAEGPRHELQHDAGRARRASGRTSGRRSRLLGPTLAARRQRARAASTPAFPNTRAFARRSCPASSETPATIDAVAAVDRAGARARCSRPSCGGLLDELKPDDASTSPGSSTRSLTALPAGRPRRPVRDAARSCRPATSKIAGRRRSTSERGELQGVLVRDGRPRRREPELRRQRPLRALPGGGGGDQTISTGKYGGPNGTAQQARSADVASSPPLGHAAAPYPAQAARRTSADGAVLQAPAAARTSQRPPKTGPADGELTP